MPLWKVMVFGGAASAAIWVAWSYWLYYLFVE